MNTFQKAVAIAFEIAAIPIFIWTLFHFHYPGIGLLTLLGAALVMAPMHKVTPFAAMPFLFAIAMLYGAPATVITIIAYTVPLIWIYRKTGIPRLMILLCGNICCSFCTPMAFHVLNPINFWVAALAMVAVSFLINCILLKPHFWPIPYLLAMGALGVALASRNSFKTLWLVFMINTAFWWIEIKWRTWLLKKYLQQKEKGATGAAPVS